MSIEEHLDDALAALVGTATALQAIQAALERSAAAREQLVEEVARLTQTADRIALTGGELLDQLQVRA
jgi:hypothetical protein